MKTPYTIFFITACLLLSIAAQAQEENDEQKRALVEKNTTPFNLNYFSISENSFYVLEAMVVNNK
ncbi:hypothetical protein O4H25_15220, partial [Staphylococcus equorum]|uniref:hypothetical protein n=1 Tax=Staphylococcus equorum TaxID=246432 RepID=UPI0022B00DFF